MHSLDEKEYILAYQKMLTEDKSTENEYTLYFISDSDMSGETISPRVPDSIMNTEEDKVNRISASMSINGCLCGIGGYQVGDVAYVHTFRTSECVQPTKEQVPDAPFTGELWVIEPVVLELFSVIEVTDVIDSTLGNMENTQYGFKMSGDEGV